MQIGEAEEEPEVVPEEEEPPPAVPFVEETDLLNWDDEEEVTVVRSSSISFVPFTKRHLGALSTRGGGQQDRGSVAGNACGSERRRWGGQTIIG